MKGTGPSTSIADSANESVPLGVEPDVVLSGETVCPTDAEMYGSAVVTFDSGTAATTAGVMSSDVIAKLTPAPADADIRSYLSRPVRIATYEWNDISTFGFHIDPWVSLLSDANVRAKLTGYKYLRTSLCLEILVNGNPFQYGQLMVSYQYQNGTPLSDDGDSRQHSMLPHVIVEPTDSKTHSMCLPFTSPGDYIDLNAGDGAQIGILNIDQIVPLRALDNGVTKADITIFAWMQDPVLAGPTSVGLATMTPQGMDGPVSAPSAFVASIASRLTDIPIIGRFARATELGGNAISQIASLFGFSRPMATNSPSEMVSRPSVKLAPFDRGVVGDKLSMYSNQELSIDPAILGADQSKDELALSNFVHRKTLMTSILWEDSAAVDDIILEELVSPMMFSSSAFTSAVVTSYQTAELSAVAYASLPFEDWRGAMVVKVKPVCSRYHRGRIRVGWEPNPTGTIDQAAFNGMYSTIVDLSEERDYEFTIPYIRGVGFLENPWGNNTGIRTDADEELHNGRFFISVVNQLTSQGDVVPPVELVIWVAGGSDLQFNRPRNLGFISSMQPQGGDILGDAEQETTIKVSWGESSATNDLNAVHYGEVVTSFRPMLKRMTEIKTLAPYVAGTINLNQQFIISGPKYPPMPVIIDTMNPDKPGVFPPTESQRAIPDNAIEANFCSTSVYSYLDPCFLGRRGGYRWSLDMHDTLSARGGEFSLTSVSRDSSIAERIAASITWYVGNFTNFTTDTYGRSEVVPICTNPASFMGSGLVKAGARTAPVFEIPDYNNLRYHLQVLKDNERRYEPTPSNAWLASTDSGDFANGSALTPAVKVYAGAADDFTFMGFVGVPKLYSVWTFENSVLDSFDGRTSGVNNMPPRPNFPLLV